MSSDIVEIERKPPLARVILDRPEARNALSRAVVEGLFAAAAALAGDREIRLVTLTGAGEGVFCAGADLKERRGMSMDETRGFVTRLGATFDAWAALPQLTVCLLGGSAYGGGLELALTCDLRVAAEGAELGLTEVRLGILPGAGGTQRLPRLVGVARAKELVLLGRRVPVRRALEIGLVNEVVPRSELPAAEARLCEEIAGCAPVSVSQAKAAIDGGFALPMTEGLKLERRCYDVTLVTEDRNEGICAFAEKRPPVYRGR